MYARIHMGIQLTLYDVYVIQGRLDEAYIIEGPIKR